VRVVALLFDDPSGAQHGGTKRTRSLLASLARLGWTVDIVHPAGQNAAAAEPVPGVRSHGVATRTSSNGRGHGRLGVVKRALLPMPTIAGGWHPALADAVRELSGADVFLTSQLRGVPYFEHANAEKLWFDQLDVWSVFAIAEVRRRRGIPKITAELQRRKMANLERQSVARSWLSSAAGYADAQLLAGASAHPVHWLPMHLEPVPVGPTQRDGRTAGLLANFNFWPNLDAYKVLSEQWLPGLRAAGWKVIVAGHGSDALPVVDGIDCIGPVEGLSDFYSRVDLSLAPIRLGGGIKVKIIEALVTGCPVVATGYALEGFPPELREILPTMPIGSWDEKVAQRSINASALATEHATGLFSRAAFERRVRQVIGVD
jgi:glycosyltransferase involved in cell wall biosynthesis